MSHISIIPGVARANLKGKEFFLLNTTLHAHNKERPGLMEYIAVLSSPPKTTTLLMLLINSLVRKSFLGRG